MKELEDFTSFIYYSIVGQYTVRLRMEKYINVMLNLSSSVAWTKKSCRVTNAWRSCWLFTDSRLVCGRAKEKKTCLSEAEALRSRSHECRYEHVTFHTVGHAEYSATARICRTITTAHRPRPQARHSNICLLTMMSVRAVGLGQAFKRGAFNSNRGKSTSLMIPQRYHIINIMSCVAQVVRNVLSKRWDENLQLRNRLLWDQVVNRSIQTQSLPPSASEEILNQQRLKRPSSPHFTIYQPQLTWIGSIANRVTGVGLSVRTWIFNLRCKSFTELYMLVLYGYAIAYLVAPTTFDSAHVIEVVAGLPDVVKLSAKTILAAPFAYHSLNGLRHLGWDMGQCMSSFSVYISRVLTRLGFAVLSLKGAYYSGYAVLGATAVSTIALVLIWYRRLWRATSDGCTKRAVLFTYQVFPKHIFTFGMWIPQKFELQYLRQNRLDWGVLCQCCDKPKYCHHGRRLHIYTVIHEHIWVISFHPWII